MELSEEKKNVNFTLWVQKLKDYNCYSESLINELGDKIKNGTFNIVESQGGAYDGALLNVILGNLCTIAFHINENAFGKNERDRLKHPFLSINNDMLMRVLLLQHIAKADLYVPQPENWKRSKGYPYEFNSEITTQLKLGEKSAYMCLKHGINLSDEEFEAMTIIDKEDKAFNPYMSPLVVLVKMVNQLAQVELSKKYKYDASL